MGITRIYIKTTGLQKFNRQKKELSDKALSFANKLLKYPECKKLRQKLLIISKRVLNNIISGTTLYKLTYEYQMIKRDAAILGIM